ncbi:MAG: indolepyruvate oxidoreductase subunit beta [Firmicutes bacterium]|nr:indolepyruvate oxidoreductase subunit beta [Bacillota bacterium]
MSEKEVKSCLLCGVGGQGTVLASRIIAAAAMAKGLRARTAETIGMAQRGGSVVSHVRIGEEIASSMIPLGTADVMIGFEPGEAAANIKYLKEDGVLIVSSKQVKPVTASLGQSAYDGDECLAWLRENVRRCIVIDPDEIIEACGSPKVLNVAMTGALAETGTMSLGIADMEEALKIRMKPKLIEMNRKALHMGAQCASER